MNVPPKMVKKYFNFSYIDTLHLSPRRFSPTDMVILYKNACHIRNIYVQYRYKYYKYLGAFIAVLSNRKDPSHEHQSNPIRPDSGAI